MLLTNTFESSLEYSSIKTVILDIDSCFDNHTKYRNLKLSDRLID